ncbi:Os02g0750701 [Oryza sativa Japonica Group]|uniref:Os02g0750701 protein n=1 Tax=Oryza sativa subsp. japonica TaxID=39947 RepID=A0A0P0VPV7_ORYSJ|nr:hypothetical protein EE612_013715 [Oryza sativa]BAS80943.1 Os02g0750701 [Oryza sativa Japonica Group]
MGSRIITSHRVLSPNQRCSRSGQKRKKKSVYSYRIDAGIFCLSPCGHRARMNSLSAETVVEGSYLLGPMSVPSKSRNLTSIGSFPPAISRPDRRPPPPTPQDPRNPGSEIHSTKQIARNPRGHAKDRVLMNNSCFRVGVESERAATRWEERKRRGGRKERRDERRGGGTGTLGLPSSVI